jgi:hypothetical protein
MLVAEAYKLTDDRVTGGPGWIKWDRVDIVAKAVPTSTEDDLRQMLQEAAGGMKPLERARFPSYPPRAIRAGSL